MNTSLPTIKSDHIRKVNRSPLFRQSAFTYGLLSIVSLLGLWVLITTVFPIVNPQQLPSPLSVIDQLVRIAREPFGGGTLFAHIGASLGRWMLGFLLAALGIPLGIFMAWIPAIRAFVHPLFEFLRYIPPIAWIPLAVLWFGASTTSQVAIVFLAAFPPAVINSYLGVTQAEPILLRAAATLGASQSTILRRVVVPVATPAIFAGMRISLSNGWMAVVGAELIAGTLGLGFLIIQGQYSGSTAIVIAGMVTIGALGAGLDVIARRLQKIVLPWRSNETEGH